MARNEMSNLILTGRVEMKKLSNKLLGLLFMSFLFSCGSGQYVKYEKQVRFDVMQCSKMCSTGNVSMIQKFDCVCNLNTNRMPSNSSANSSSNGNTNTIYINGNQGYSQQPQRNSTDWGVMSNALMQFSRPNPIQTIPND